MARQPHQGKKGKTDQEPPRGRAVRADGPSGQSPDIYFPGIGVATKDADFIYRARTLINDYGRSLEHQLEEEMYDPQVQLRKARECILSIDTLFLTWKAWKKDRS